MSLVLNGTDGVTFNDTSLQGAAASPYVLKNRIINGDMVIDQRNAGASGTAINVYTVDRFSYNAAQASKGTWQQNAAAVTPPVGFSNYLGFTSSSSYSVLAGDYFTFAQPIEGYNIADLAWGTANAKTVTLSFWARSSLTGTFGGALYNSGLNYSYPFSYSIPTANTWTQISVTITGPTAGTWLTTNGNGVSVGFGLGVGSTYNGTAGSWSSNFYISATGATSVVGTNGATFYITGVQLEQNTSATPFERRLYGQELVNCQRYYWVLAKQTTATIIAIANMSYYNATYLGGNITLPVTMRTTPSLDAASGTNYYSMFRNNGNNTVNSWAIVDSHPQVVNIYNTAQASGTAGQAGWSATNFNGAYVAFNAEL